MILETGGIFMRNLKRIVSMLAILGMCAILPLNVSAMSSQTELEKKIIDYVEERSDGVASVSIGVYQNDETISELYYGYADREGKVKADQDTVYEWGSTSKLMVWTSVMQLYEQGKLDLNKDIQEYLPKDFLEKSKYKEPITMIHLMNHTAGFQETTYDTEVSTIEDMVDLETALKQTQPARIYQPGLVTAYSNWGTALAALIVERISGVDYVEYVHKNILEPLEMEHTSIGGDYEDNPWVSKQRMKLKSYLIMEGINESYGPSIRYILLYPAGSVTGTLGDYMRFAKAFVPKEGEQTKLFQNQETLDFMKQATSYYGDSELVRNAHGLWALHYEQPVLGHAGNTTACSSNLMFDPKSGLGIVVMTNEPGETAFNYGLLSVVFGEFGGEEVENSGVQSNKVNPFNTPETLAGIYTFSRTYEKGFGKIYKYMGSLLPLKQTEEDGIYKLSIGQGTLRKVGEHQYVMDNENGWKYLMYETKNEKKQTILQMMSADVIKENKMTFGLKIISIGLFALTILICALKLVIDLMSMVIRKIRKKTLREHKKLPVSYYALLLTQCGIGVLFYQLILMPLDSASVTIVPTTIRCVLMLVAMIALSESIFKLIKTFKEWGRKPPYGMIVMSFYMYFFIIYWRLFDFWSC